MSPWQSCQEETVALWTQKSPCVLWSTLSWSERYSFQNEKMLPWFCSFLTYFSVKSTYLYFWKSSNSNMDYFVIWGNCSKIVLQGNKNVFECFQSGFLSTLFFINPPHYHGCRARYAPFKKRSTEVFMCGNRTHFSILFLWIQ